MEPRKPPDRERATGVGATPLQPGVAYASQAAPATPAAPDGVLEALFESSAAGLAVVSMDGTLLRVNPAFARLLGGRPDEFHGVFVADVTHPEDRGQTERLIRELRTRRLSDFAVEKRYVRRDGTVLWVQVAAVAAHAPDGSPTCLLETVRDVSATRDLAARLRVANTRYQRLVDANIIGIAVATEAGVVEANDEYLRVAGTTRTEFEAHGIDWRALTPPDDLAKDAQGLREIVERGACTPFEKAYVRPDGTRVPILVGGALLEREPLTWIAFALDLSELRAAEVERDRLLEDARSARAVAEAALHARDALLATVAHDLRTPIGANAGYASLMRDGIPEPLPPAHQESVVRMIANQKHMLRLIDRLLEFARSASGRTAFEVEPQDVDTLLAGIETLMAPQIRAAGVTYVCEPCETPLRVNADRAMVTQILTNLVGNAIKFTAAGGRVTVGATAADGVVRITVSDTGSGIPPHQLAAVFEPFVQGAATAQRPASPDRPRGFGLGLAIGRELARGMGGDLSVRSELGVGTTFTLALPAA